MLHVACWTRSKRISLPRVSLFVFAVLRGTFVGKQTAVMGSTSHTRACACTRLFSLAYTVDRRRVNNQSASYRDGIGRIQSNSSIRCPVASNQSQSKSREGFMPVLM